MTIRPLQPHDLPELLRLMRGLFPQADLSDLERQLGAFWSMGQINSVPATVCVLDRGGGRLGGFIEVSLRNVADGCHSTPVGYIEAWYVDDDLRQNGHGRMLVEAAERWAQSQGCVEMASDCLIDNTVSEQAHLAMGFELVDRCINFRKTISTRSDAITGVDWIALSDSPLPVARAVEFVASPQAGGIDVFLGTTRAESNTSRQPLIALDYEAYGEMALEQMRDLARRARQRWPIVRLALLHRTGRVRLAEPSVVIAVACPHRGEAFDACRWLIDTLKTDVPIWKKEIWSDGSGTWVDPQQPSRHADG